MWMPCHAMPYHAMGVYIHGMAYRMGSFKRKSGQEHRPPLRRSNDGVAPTTAAPDALHFTRNPSPRRYAIELPASATTTTTTTAAAAATGSTTTAAAATGEFKRGPKRLRNEAFAIQTTMARIRTSLVSDAGLGFLNPGVLMHRVFMSLCIKDAVKECKLDVAVMLFCFLVDVVCAYVCRCNNKGNRNLTCKTSSSRCSGTSRTKKWSN